MNGNHLAVFSYHKPLFLTIAATCWSVRLASFLFYRVLQTGGDKCVAVVTMPELHWVLRFLVLVPFWWPAEVIIMFCRVLHPGDINFLAIVSMPYLCWCLHVSDAYHTEGQLP
jgi:hypothetical protein